PFPETALQGATSVAYVIHIGCGTIGLLSGTVAAFAEKGERLHRAARKAFFVSMLAMAIFAAWLAIAIPGQMSNLLGAILTSYLVATGWRTVKQEQRTGGDLVHLRGIGLFVDCRSGRRRAGREGAIVDGHRDGHRDCCCRCSG